MSYNEINISDSLSPQFSQYQNNIRGKDFTKSDIPAQHNILLWCVQNSGETWGWFDGTFCRQLGEKG